MLSDAVSLPGTFLQKSCNCVAQLSQANAKTLDIYVYKVVRGYAAKLAQNGAVHKFKLY
jgi:hypothetical protein